VYRYKNRSSRTQSINLDSGKSIHVQPGEEVSLEGDDFKSPEVQAKLRGQAPTGSLISKEDVDAREKRRAEGNKEVTPKEDDFLTPRNGERG
jgi:hypothetical protein